MRFAWLLLIVAACDHARSDQDAAHDAPPRPSDCAVLCTADNADCGTIPYEQLPPRCTEVCYWGSCCALLDGMWSKQVYDCARPVDAGVNPPVNGA